MLNRKLTVHIYAVSGNARGLVSSPFGSVPDLDSHTPNFLHTFSNSYNMQHGRLRNNYTQCTT
jgi:hypothetical protein